MKHAPPMRTRKKFILVALCATVGIGALWIAVRRNSEPSYHGRKLSELLRLSDGRYNDNDAERQRAGEAISQIGTNAIPYLIDWMRYEESTWRERLGEAIWDRFGKNPFGSKRSDQADLAAQAFWALGPAAADEVIPQLMSLISKTKSPKISIRALYALAYTGRPNALPALLAVFTNHSSPVHLNAAFPLSLLGTNSQPAVPTLIGCLKDSDEAIARTAAWTLGKLKLNPEAVVPALINALNDPRPKVQRDAVNTLRQFGEAARPAIPALLTALTARDKEVRYSATNAILAIQPEALKDVPPK